MKFICILNFFMFIFVWEMEEFDRSLLLSDWFCIYLLVFSSQSKLLSWGSPAWDSQGIYLYPLPAPNLGPSHPQALAEIMELGRAISQNEAEATRRLLQRLLILLMKGNAALMIRQFPVSEDSEVTGTQ